MPWVAEKADDDKKVKAAKAALAKAQKALISSKSRFQKTKARGKGRGSIILPASDCDEEEKLALLSKVIKSGCVETFNWEYTERKIGNGRNADKLITKKLENLQAILINPKWAEHGFDTLASSEEVIARDRGGKY